MVAAVELDVDGRSVRLSNPDKVFFPERGETKLDLARYVIAVGAAALRGVYERPTVMRRFPDGALGEAFFQKRVPARRPDWIETARMTFPSGRHADELCPTSLAHLVWAVNLGCLGWDPWPVRRRDLDRPDELRVDLDPAPGVPFADVRTIALAVKELLDELGLTSWPKTSGSRGIHVYVRIPPEHTFTDVRRAALALAREIERRHPRRATSKWWKEERGDRVFLDYNQNARDRTVASAYSARANAEGRVSCPLTWAEVPDIDPSDLTIATVPARVAAIGDPWAEMDEHPSALTPLLELAERDEQEDPGKE